MNTGFRAVIINLSKDLSTVIGDNSCKLDNIYIPSGIILIKYAQNLG